MTKLASTKKHVMTTKGRTMTRARDAADTTLSRAAK
jgi:hypothetical protein